MGIYKFSASLTVSAYTTVEADSLEEAIEIAECRNVASLCHYPFGEDDSEAWHFDNDGVPFDIQEDSQDGH